MSICRFSVCHGCMFRAEFGLPHRSRWCRCWSHIEEWISISDAISTIITGVSTGECPHEVSLKTVRVSVGFRKYC
ncbi:unnamed protein product [Haemonchus placei]|uniref:Phlebovirus_G2 domain-containing protein n=1 Tax=Haemonchus placei TaxID=6290 RepID=A0A0N4VVK8_HAEPC|nr:unnamed protein product [Haemonchus placei]